MTRPITANELRAMQLMVGQHAFGFVAGSSLMGHSTLRGSTVYTAANDPVTKFVVSMMANDTDEAIAGMDVLIRKFPEFLAQQMSEAGLPYNDQSPSTGIDSAEAFRCYVIAQMGQRRAAA